jgi:hypothetical protein
MAAVKIDRGVRRADRNRSFRSSDHRRVAALRCRSDSAALLDALKSAGVPAVEIGEVLPPGKPLIAVV